MSKVGSKHIPMELGQVMKDKKDLVARNWVKRDFGSKGSSRGTRKLERTDIVKTDSRIFLDSQRDYG